MKNMPRLLLATLVASTLALSGCAFQLPTAQGTQSAQKTQSAQGKQQSSAAPTPTQSSEPSAGPSSTDGLYGAFGSMNEACVSVSATWLSISLLPLASLAGGNPDDVKKAQDELAKMQGKVPDELKPHFAKLKAFIDSAGSDYSKYGTGEFEALSKPIEDWVNKNCK
ncbi:hypothetical protein [Arthrobacter sp. AZCC_0090]|uniref:hypothetical protein n=1 Tax=Arthrobacter sp. AZCC_0090 TaxID=2735881 RepID=UPI0016158DF4|nr:hypothetical protein [Arthrobacter sp. AZCC_0090]MBB6406711.1 hypothetical protein [Arthrobacter sp. AZCC_0090]